jgi:oxalate decarboxylase
MYSLRVAEVGMREPHWHSVTAEMGYVRHGDARMTVMIPDGSLDTWNMTTGDMYFIPRAYPQTSATARRQARTLVRCWPPRSIRTSRTCRPSPSPPPIR